MADSPEPVQRVGAARGGMAGHPELELEQAYIDHAYACLDAARERAMNLRKLSSVGPGGTHQARLESEVVEATIRDRLAQLRLGDVALVFGRIDRRGDADAPGDDDQADEAFYIGRIAVADERQEPVVVDWRAPVAEPFYRATGRSPMGLSRRRHFATKGRHLLGIEDEVFGTGLDGTGEVGDGVAAGIVGQGALLAALDRRRSGFLGDIVATIQSEQDDIIRSELAGVLIVQGGPGTGKTVVALHRAAYLLYTHRFPLEGQGVLVVGPNRLYLRYIERVLPSLGEAGVELAVLADLVAEDVSDAREDPLAGRVKGDLRMVDILAKAVRDRERPLREDLAIGFGLVTLRCTAAASERIVRSARRRARTHNVGRKVVEQALFEELAASARTELEPHIVRARLRSDPAIREALERMWPVLTPGDLLRDLFGSRALLRIASRDRLSEPERAALFRERGERDELRWTGSDVPLLDEARSLLGPFPRSDEDEAVRTYGHIVVDEAQDLSPMQLRMLSRRSLGGSMTVVGDIAQATGPWAPPDWDAVLEHLPTRKPARVRELSIGYRTPASILTLANRVLAVAFPGLRPPDSVREGDSPAEVIEVEAAALPAEVAALAATERDAVGEGNVAIVGPDSLVGPVAEALREASVAHGEAERSGLMTQVTVVPVRLVKGLELDSVIVVEPARIVSEEPQGLRSLYVALTRSTRRLTLVHAESLPEALGEVHGAGCAGI
ncbi:MAG: ATP-binding domain-containing protein [Acidimicrobiales bacterium]